MPNQRQIAELFYSFEMWGWAKGRAETALFPAKAFTTLASPRFSIPAELNSWWTAGSHMCLTGSTGTRRWKAERVHSARNRRNNGSAYRFQSTPSWCGCMCVCAWERTSPLCEWQGHTHAAMFEWNNGKGSKSKWQNQTGIVWGGGFANTLLGNDGKKLEPQNGTWNTVIWI